MIAADRIGWALVLATWAVLGAGLAEGARLHLTTTSAVLAAALGGRP